MKVIIIEDNAEISEAVALCLQTYWPGTEIAFAILGKKGIEAVRGTLFDLVILDINLPDIDGFAVLQEVRCFSSVPVVILTVRGTEKDINRGLEMGANAYVIKPFKPRDLLTRLQEVLQPQD